MPRCQYKTFSFTIFETDRLFDAAMLVKLLYQTSHFTCHRATTTYKNNHNTLFCLLIPGIF